ncbi:hypothetical protein HFP72_12735 [Nocardiopsis sp. ARC36]
MPTSTTPLTTDEQVSMLTDGDDKISPATFPVPTASPGYIETLAAALRTAGQSVADTGNDIDSSWGALTSSYKAPEADELYTVLGPVARDGDDVLTGLNNAANALENFAEDLRGIKRRWNSLRTEAYAFRARIDAKGDDWRDAEGVAGFFGIGESPDVEENSRLISEGTGIIEDYEAAERDCANQINHYVPDRTGFEAMPSGGGELDPDVFYHGYEDSLSDLATEWDMGGATTDEHWWVDAGAAVWDFGVGAVEGTGAMLGMHSSEGGSRRPGATPCGSTTRATSSPWPPWWACTTASPTAGAGPAGTRSARRGRTWPTRWCPGRSGASAPGTSSAPPRSTSSRWSAAPP